MYYALYRKYRPLDFDSVKGQTAVTETLKNQIITDRISHSYLFTGTRGTGKTTCAKIFARAINCESPVNGNPCNQCPTCKGILDGSIFSVTEMDAASNNSVDDIRRIIDEVVYPPLDAKYRVYIIDEVHMLSSGAFNALLKTIEEPPAHAVFILATTEIQKVPATVKSRCQRFDMSRLSKDELKSFLAEIVRAEGKHLDEESLDTVATLGDGSARDSLSVLEKVIDIDDPEKVKSVLGVCDENELFALSSAIASKDVQKIYETVADFYASSKEFGLLCSDLSEFYRKILICRTAREPAAILGLTPKDAERYTAESRKYTAEHIIYIMNRLRDNYALLRQSINKRADTEVCLLRCAIPELGTDTDALSARMSLIEKKASDGTLTSAKTQTAPVIKETVQHPAAEMKPQKEAPQAPVKTEPIPQPQAEKPEPVARKEETPVSVSPEKMQAPPTAEVSESGYKEFLGFDEIIKEIKASDMILSRNLSKNCRALIKGRDILLLFTNVADKTDAQAGDSIQKIRKALDNMHMQESKLVLTVGSPEDYLGHKTNEEIMAESMNLFKD